MQKTLVALVLLVAPCAHAAGGTIFDNGGNVFVTYAATHWDGFPELDFSLPTAPDGMRRNVVRYSGWWVRPTGGASETPLGAPDVELYDSPNGQAGFAWNTCESATTVCAFGESGWVVDAQGPNGAATFVSSLSFQNNGSSSGAIEVFHFLDPLMHGQPSGTESITFLRPNIIDFSADDATTLGIRRLRYRGTGTPVSNCSQDNLTNPATILRLLGDGTPTNFTQPGVTGLSSALGMECAMQWHLTVPPGEIRTLRISVSLGIDDLLQQGDSDFDNMPDVYFEDVATGAVRLWPMKGALRRTAPRDLPATPGFRVVGVGDFNRDYVSDILLRTEAPPSQVLAARFGDGIGYGAPVVLGALIHGPEWEVAATGDFNFDGYTDVLWRNTQTQLLEIALLDNIGQIGIATPSPDHAADNNWKVVAASDWDRDHDLDLLWYNNTSGKIVFWWLDAAYQRVTGGFADPPNAGDNNWSVVASTDFGPGPAGALASVFATPDILWRNATSSRLVVWHMNAAGRRTSGQFTTPDSEAANWKVVGPR